MDPLCYLNGEILPLSEAKVGILDLGLLRGFGIYEGITAINGEPFRFDDHFTRFENSAKKLGLTLSRSGGALRESMRTLVAKNSPGGRASIRLVLTGGEALGGLEHVAGRETLFMIVEPTVPLPQELYEKGATLITHVHQRFMPDAKTIHYITAVTLQEKRRDAGALEILYISGGRALECATSNIFIVKDGVVVTPGADVLPGVTRKVALELAGRAPQLPTRESDVSLAELFGADEVFITSSFKDIVPIVAVDGRQIASGAPGPLTRELAQRFASYAH